MMAWQLSGCTNAATPVFAIAPLTVSVDLTDPDPTLAEFDVTADEVTDRTILITKPAQTSTIIGGTLSFSAKETNMGRTRSVLIPIGRPLALPVQPQTIGLMNARNLAMCLRVVSAVSGITRIGGFEFELITGTLTGS